MNTLLVVVDFNETSKNCALYALQLAKYLQCSNVVLYHRFQVLNVANPLAGFDQISAEPYANDSVDAFEVFKQSLGNIPEGIHIKMYHGATELIDSIEQMIDTVGADLVLMGIENHGSWFKEKFGHEDGLDVAKVVKVPVILVPPTYSFINLDKVIFLTDLQKVDQYTPVQSITHFLAAAQIQTLNIVHIDFTHNAQQQTLLESLFNNKVAVKFHLINDEFNHAIDNFKNEQGVDIVIALAQETSMWQSLFNNHTKHLASHTQIPLLLTHK
jgi:hypothetical protein